MPRVRRRSINDINDQYNRIRAAGASGARLQRAGNIAQRYAQNIENSSEWRNAFNAAGQRFDVYNGSNRNLRSYGPERRTAQYGAADNVRVARRTYMGQSRGATAG